MSSKTNSNSRCFAELQSDYYHYFLEFCRNYGDHTLLAGVAQLVEHHLAKVDVEGSNPFARSTLPAFGKKIGYLVSQTGNANGQILVRRVPEIDCFASCTGYNGKKR